MESTAIINSSPSSPSNKLNDLYSSFDTQSSLTVTSRSSSTDSLSSFNKTHPEAQTSIASTSNHYKESAVKLPYPVLSDHRDPTSVLPLLQKETQATSKKILDVTEQIEDCEKRLTSVLLSEKNKNTLKYERVKRKQQLDALKKHERRVNLQIDYITTKTEIQGLEDERKQMSDKKDSDEYQQIDILSRKLRQKLDQMKIYMRTRNEQMKKMSQAKQQTSTSNDIRKQVSSSQKPQPRLSSSDLNRKRPSSNTSITHSNKHFKPTAHHYNKPPAVRLASRSTSHPTKSHPIQTPTVRFLNKTTNSANSTSPTTPASSSSTLSPPPLIASTSTECANNAPASLQQISIPSLDEDDDLDLDLNIDELFDDDPYADQIDPAEQLKTNRDSSKSKS